MPKISACIVAYCDYDEVCAAVRSILHYTPAPDLALYVVDNGSPDGCGRQLAETDFGDSRVTVLPLEKNIGFGKGHNYVLDRLTSDVHFILNPDILLTGDVLEDMAAWLLARQLAPKLGGCFKKADDHYTMQDEDLTVPRRIEFCTGSFMAVRTDVFKEIGGFDPGYFMYVEDADLTQKVLQKGTVWLAPQFSAIHAWHRAPMRDAGKFKMQLVSMGRYFKKWGCGKGTV